MKRQQLSHTAWIVISVILWIVAFGSGIYVMYTFKMPPLMTGVLIGLAVFAMGIHLYKEVKHPGYTKSVLAIPSAESSKRIAAYDYLRVIAVFMVLFLHLIELSVEGHWIETTRKAYVGFMILDKWAGCCNIMFVMVSGALLLPWKEEKLPHFYYRRMTRVVLPMFVYYLWYLWQNGQLGVMSLRGIAGKLYHAEMTYAPTFWLFYIILSLYVVFPFLRIMLKAMNEKTLLSVVGVIYVLLFISNYMPKHFGVPMAATEWVSISILGYWASRPETRKYDRILMLLGLVSAGLGALTVTFFPFLDRGGNFSLIRCTMSIGIFAAVFHFERIFSKGNVVLSFLSKYSLPVMLIHWSVITWIVLARIKLHIGDFHGFNLIVGIFLTTVISLFFGFVIENMVMTPVYFLQEKLEALAAKLMRKA